MNREDAKDLTLSVLTVVSALLSVYCIVLHVKCARLEADVASLSADVAALARKVDPPQEPSLVERAKETCEKVVSAAAKGIEAAKKEYSKDRE